MGYYGDELDARWGDADSASTADLLTALDEACSRDHNSEARAIARELKSRGALAERDMYLARLSASRTRGVPMNDRRIKELAKLTKGQLIEKHVAAGGMMGRAEYARWSKDELLNAVIEDETYQQTGA